MLHKNKLDDKYIFSEKTPHLNQFYPTSADDSALQIPGKCAGG